MKTKRIRSGSRRAFRNGMGSCRGTPAMTRGRTKTVSNKTPRPLSVPLPRGKTFRLGRALVEGIRKN
jgi:hypothetical protein